MKGALPVGPSELQTSRQIHVALSESLHTKITSIFLLWSRIVQHLAVHKPPFSLSNGLFFLSFFQSENETNEKSGNDVSTRIGGSDAYNLNLRTIKHSVLRVLSQLGEVRYDCTVGRLLLHVSRALHQIVVFATVALCKNIRNERAM